MLLTIKVQCPCGTRFAFEVLPVNGRMPVQVNCPTCNADDTEIANAQIQQQLSAQSASAAVPVAAPASVPVAVPVAIPVAVPATTPRPSPVAIPSAAPAPASSSVAIPVAQTAPAPSLPTGLVIPVAQPAQLAAPTPRVPSASPPAPQPPTASGLRIAGSHHAASAPVASVAVPVAVAANEAGAEAAAQLCPKHKTEPAVEKCKVCGKLICLKCMEMFGYVCSVYCRQQATAKRIYVPVYANQKTVVAGKSHAMAKRITVAVVALVVLLLGFWFWYAWFARDPKIVYSLPIPKVDFINNPKAIARPEEFYQLIAPGQLLSIKNKQVSLFDVTEQHSIWSTPLRNDSAKPKDSADAPDESDFYFGSPRVVVTTNDLWVVMSGLLARFDRQTGSPKDTGIKDKILNITVRPDCILVVGGTRGAHEILANISLPDGNVQTEEISAAPKKQPVAPAQPAAKVAAKKTKPNASVGKSNLPVGQLKNLAAESQPTPAPAAQADANAMPDDFEDFSYRMPFTAAGPNAVEMKTKLLEQKSVSHQAMKPKGKSVLDGNVSASQGLELAQEMMNDSRREETGGVEVEDVSRYQVTLHRRLQKDVPDWTGEVNGKPQLFPLKTVDLLVAGQGLMVFDKQNKKLWDAKLTFPVVRHYDFLEEEPAPSLETKDALYFADAGTLTRFDLASGNVRWRYNTVGITRIQADERGGIYIVTSTAGPESIQYSQQVNIHEKIKPVVMRLDAATGKVSWRNEGLGDEIMLTGKFLYATRVSMTYALLRLEEGPDTHYNLNLVDPSNGSLIWNYHQGNHPVMKTEVQKNWILLQMDDEVVVLKFFTF
jgi:hypothetical protein